MVLFKKKNTTKYILQSKGLKLCFIFILETLSMTKLLEMCTDLNFNPYVF